MAHRTARQEKEEDPKDDIFSSLEELAPRTDPDREMRRALDLGWLQSMGLDKMEALDNAWK